MSQSHTHDLKQGAIGKFTLKKEYAKCALKKGLKMRVMHFVLECPAYNKVRKLLSRHVDPNEHDLNNQFIQLIPSSNQNIICDMARYLKKKFKIRNNPNEQTIH